MRENRLPASGRRGALWDLRAHLYRRFRRWPPFAIVANRERALLRQGLAEVPAGEGRALDVATGTGEGLAALMGKVEWYGLDSSRAMLAYAKRRLPGMRLVRGDALALPFRPGCFVLVTCIGLAEYLPAVTGLLRETARTLRPGGAALVSTSPTNLLLFMRRALGHRLHRHSHDSISRAATAAGFVLVKVLASCSQRLYVLRKAGEEGQGLSVPC
ncbi:MAG: class I SAM-dependent methyltransferase [bacterium]|jgi:SAM-dependent methyltransferase|nr:class I SAM-dependent methyltransferase [candidate division KSB1 bacterium]MDH7561603.1 class I SAM-dependent methyltransferase [bacterium]